MSPLIACVGAVIHDEQGRLLVIRRGHAPAAGRWSLPGGHVEVGESDEQAVVREVAEETGLTVVVESFVGSVRVRADSGSIFVVNDYVARVTAGVVRAGDDARDARWVSATQLHDLVTTDGLIAALTAWNVLPD